MKNFYSLFVFANAKYIYLKRRINFLSNHGTHNEWKWKILERKIIEHFYGSGGKVEALSMKIISLESLHSVL